MAASSAMSEIEKLDPRQDCQRIIKLSMRRDFPFDSTRALEIALFRTYCSPRISGLLDRTGEFRSAAQKRYDDTDIIISTLIEEGYDSENGRAALRRMNQIHARFPEIDNDDFLYVLSTFVFEPLRWNDRFGWRRLTDREQLACFYFFRDVGIRMGIRNIPEEMAQFRAFSEQYERDWFQFAPANHAVGTATLEMMCRWFPAPLRWAVRRGVYAMLGLIDQRLCDCFGFPNATSMERWALMAAMRIRAWTLALLPRRKRELLRTKMKTRSYPAGYELAQLGPAEP